MFYHPNDNKATIITKYLFFFVGFLSIAGIGSFIFIGEIKKTQKEIILKVDIKNKVNICLPEDDKIFQKSFFNF